jgi:hypothetical protein
VIHLSDHGTSGGPDHARITFSRADREVTVTQSLHPRHGVHQPTDGTPARTPGSVRRTSTIDILRPGGLTGPLVLTGRARDLHTLRHGGAELVATAGCEAVIDEDRVLRAVQPAARRPRAGSGLRSLATEPDRPALRELVGPPISSGFRRRLDEADPDLAAEHNLLYALLDDLPVAALISGHAVAEGLHRGAASLHQIGPLDEIGLRAGHGAGREASVGAFGLMANVCAGFADGATIMVEFADRGRPPLVTGPVAPSVLNPADPLAWHELPALPPTAMRRHRRMDVTPSTVDIFFRDSHVGLDGVETVIHEYTVAVALDGETVTGCVATARVLPWVECPAALASAGRVIGQPVTGLRDFVRRTFTGPTTCTHLNDALRSLQDVPRLLA